MSIELFDIELLRKFTDPDHPVFKNVVACWSCNGDGTQSGDDRDLRLMGAERFAHRDWDTTAFGKNILVQIPNQKHPAAVELPRGGGPAPAKYLWCIDSAREGAEGTRAPKSSELKRIPVDALKLAELLPNLEWVAVDFVIINCHGNRGSRKKREKMPDSVLYFRFTGGSGMVILTPKSEGAAS